MNNPTKSYPAFNLAINDLCLQRDQQLLIAKLNYQLANGDLVQLIGANGSGKTTLIRAIAGLHRQAEGDITYTENNQQGAFSGFYLGHENALKAELSVFENLEFYQQLYQSELTVESVIESIGLTDKANKLAKHLSSGQKRRVSLARLLMVERALWLLDEPLVALDKQSIDWLVQLIEAHIARNGAVMITSHQQIPFNQQPKILSLSEHSHD